MMDGITSGTASEDEEKSILSVDATHKTLLENIRLKTQEKNELKEITQKQLKNISELQKKCEESFIIISHLPQNRQTAANRYDEAMREIAILQNKQYKVNELLNLSMKEFDDSMVLVMRSKQQFESEIELANQRLLIYKADSKELKRLGEKNISMVQESLHSKSSLLEELNTFLKQQNLDELRNKIENTKKQIKDLDILQNDNEREMLLIENNLRSVTEKTNIQEKNMNNELTSLSDELEEWKIKNEEQVKNLFESKQEVVNKTKDCEEQQIKCTTLKKEFEQEIEKKKAIENDLRVRKVDLEYIKNELKDCRQETDHLKEAVKKVYETRDHCTAVDARIKELDERKEKMLQKQFSLNGEISAINENISKAETEFNNIKDAVVSLQNDFTIKMTNINQLKEESEQLKQTTDNKIMNLSNEIDNLNTTNNSLIESIEQKKKILNERTNHMTSMNENIEKKKAELQEKKEKICVRKKELTEFLTAAKTKITELSQLVEERKQELMKRQKQKETISLLNEKIMLLKHNYCELVDSSERQKQELKDSCNDKIEAKLKELENLKADKLKLLASAKYSASKSEFTYYGLKSQTQRLKGEMNCVKENLKTYVCENEMLKMLDGWLNTGSQCSDHYNQTESDDNLRAQGEISFDLKKVEGMDSDSSGDNEDDLPPPEMTTQEYRTAVVSSESLGKKKVSDNMESKAQSSQQSKMEDKAQTPQQSIKGSKISTILTPAHFIQKRPTSLTRKKPGKRRKEKSILDLVVDSSSSQ